MDYITYNLLIKVYNIKVPCFCVLNIRNRVVCTLCTKWYSHFKQNEKRTKAGGINGYCNKKNNKEIYKIKKQIQENNIRRDWHATTNLLERLTSAVDYRFYQLPSEAQEKAKNAVDKLLKDRNGNKRRFNNNSNNSGNSKKPRKKSK